MMKKSLSVLKNSIIISILFILFAFSCMTFAESKIIYGGSEEEVGPVVLPYKRIAVTGDSYAGLFCQFELEKAFTLDGFALPGRTILENKRLMINAMRSPDKLVYICIGVNDHYNGTTPSAFEKNLREIINEGVANNKIMFIDSYVKYPLVNVRPGEFNILTYDNIVRDLCVEYKNLYYIDVNDLATFENSLGDNIHFNQKFADGMYDRLLKIIMSIDF